MSVQQILEELPKLSPEELRKVSKCIWEIDPDRETYEAALQNAEAGFLMLDDMEAEESGNGPAAA